jgi:hypothetical protein
MKTAKVILLAVVGLLLLADISWRIWAWNSNAEIRAFSKEFKIEILHTNDVSPWPYLSGDVSAIGIIDVKTGKPIWVRWNPNDADGKDIENYYFQGQSLFSIYHTNNSPLIYNVYFRGPGKSFTWWRNSGGADTFTTRVFYDINGDLSKHEAWYDQSWQTVDRREGKNGIIISGQWTQLAFDTNGMWTTEIKTNQ